MVCLSFSAHIIGEDEYKFEDEDLEEIEALIHSLQDTLESTDIDPVLKRFIRVQVGMLKRSLDEYRIRGSKAFNSAYIEGLGQIVENEVVIRSNSDNPAVIQLRNIWDRFKAATEKAAVANKTIETWAKVLEKGSDVIDYLSKLN